MSDQFVSSGQDLGSTAEILFQPDQFDSRKVAFETQNVFNLGTAPPIDRLIRITRDAEIGFSLRQRRDDLILSSVRILVFINQNEPKAFVERKP